MLRAIAGVALVLGPMVAGCKRDEPSAGRGAPPPPPPPAAAAGGCAKGGAELTDPVSAPFFPRKSGAFCLDPQCEIKTYGDRGKGSMDEVCTKAFDGECEVYKQFGLKRVVTLRYVDDTGATTVDVTLSEFKDPAGAFGMYTKRVVADGDPDRDGAPRPLDAGGAGAMGTGNALTWKGPHLVELTYGNEQESPEALAKSSAAALSALAREIGAKLPGAADLPPSAKALPEAGRLPNGVSFVQKEPLGIKNLGPAAIGFYKDGAKRFRVLALASGDEARAKDELKTLRGLRGAQPVAGVGDEATVLVQQASKDQPKVEIVAARKGALVLAVMDDDLASAQIAKDEKIARLKAWLPAK